MYECNSNGQIFIALECSQRILFIYTTVEFVLGYDAYVSLAMWHKLEK